jgi:4-hydroxy-2-oxoheptanedioate aldolase
MVENSLKTLFKSGGAAINGWLHIPSAWTAEVMATLGWDSLTIDMQHGLADYANMIGMLQAISITPTVPMVRVTWNDPALIMRALDAGALGIICPMVNSRAETEAFVGACRYAPQGYRSYGPVRAAVIHGADYAERANDLVLTFAMIETAKALENLDDILSTPGLDAIYIGPADLSLSLGGKERSDLTEPRLVDILDQILEAARKHNIVAGIHTNSPDYAQQMIAKGFQLVSLSSDTSMLRSAAQAVLKQMKQEATGEKAAGPY